MSTYSAGLLNVGTLNATGTSATLTANTANVTNATITNLNTNNLVGVSGNLTVKGKVSQTSQFATPPSGVRSQVVMAGKDYNNTNYQPATDGAGATLPFFRLLSQGGGNPGALNLPQFGAFSMMAPGGGATGYQQTFQGVCDLNYVYMIWEPLVPTRFWTGTDLADWQALLGPANDWPNTSSVILKIDRNNGQLVQSQNIGLMMDQAYVAAGATKAIQEAAIGPGPYVADSSGNPVKDTSGNYVTQAVTGTVKTAPGYAGFQSVNNGTTWANSGDDNARGPFHLYFDAVLGVNVLYLCTVAQKYASVYKIRTDNLSMVWRRTVDPFFYSYENPELTNGGRVMRQVMVIPPRAGRTYPIIVTGATDNFSYSTTDIQDVQKLFNYFKSGGSIQAWADYGSTAGTSSNTNTNTPMWQTLMGHTPLEAGNALPLTAFRWATPGADMLTVNAVTEGQDSSGYILDTSGGDSYFEIYAPLVNGYVFSDGSANGVTASCCKTSGTFNLATGNRYASTTAPIYPWLSSLGLPTTESYAYLLSEYEMAHFPFPDGTVFDQSANYVGVVQNGPNVGSNITVSGYQILCGIKDSTGRNFLQTTPVQYQPLLKRVYKAQVGRAIDTYEAGEMNLFAGGIYMNLAYDVDTDTIIAPTGQFVDGTAGIDAFTSKLLLNDVTYKGVTYPGVHTPFNVTDPSGNIVYNAYTDDSGVKFLDSSFNGVGTNYFRGVDGSGVFQSYLPYASNLAEQNLNTNFVRGAATNYFYTYNVGFTAAGLCKADGSLINNIVTNPKSWLPGADASGNPNTWLQASFLLNRQNAYWKKINMMRDAQNFGPLFNRQGASGFTGVRVSNGELMFSVNVHGYDFLDHSFSDVDIQGAHEPLALFKNSGNNTDGCAVTIIRGLRDASNNQRKLLVHTNKHRFFLLDYYKLIDSSGNQKTLTHVPGDSSVDYQKGVQTNTWKSALLYEDEFGNGCNVGVFNGYATDANNGGTTYLMDTCLSTNALLSYNLTPGNIPGKEVHGNNIHPTNIYWAKNPALSDANISAMIATGFNGLSSVNQSNALNGLPLTKDASGNFQDPSGWKTSLVSAMTQFQSSFTGRGYKSTNSYNLQTILNNAVITGTIGTKTYGSVLNTPQNVLNYQFDNYDTIQSGFNNSGIQLYGNTVLSGNTTGILEAYNIATGYPINQPNPLPGQFVPQIRTANLGVYNQEGQRVPPLIVDGVMYGWGGANKWIRASSTGANPTQFFMWTPYGK